MFVRNTTRQQYIIVHDVDPHSGLSGYPDRTIIPSLSLSTRILPDNQYYARVQLNALLQTGALVLLPAGEEPLDTLVYRSTVGLSGYDGSTQLIPRWRDLSVTVDNRIDQVEQDIEDISLSIGVITQIETHLVTVGEAIAKEFSLQYDPISNVGASIQAGPNLVQGQDFNMAGLLFQW